MVLHIWRIVRHRDRNLGMCRRPRGDSEGDVLVDQVKYVVALLKRLSKEAITSWSLVISWGGEYVPNLTGNLAR
jgi:hypothetical protein